MEAALRFLWRYEKHVFLNKVDKLVDLRTNEDERGYVVCNSIVDKSYDDDVNHEICRLVKLRVFFLFFYYF